MRNTTLLTKLLVSVSTCVALTCGATGAYGAGGMNYKATQIEKAQRLVTDLGEKHEELKEHLLKMSSLEEEKIRRIDHASGVWRQIVAPEKMEGLAPETQKQFTQQEERAQKKTALRIHSAQVAAYDKITSVQRRLNLNEARLKEAMASLEAAQALPEQYEPAAATPLSEELDGRRAVARELKQRLTLQAPQNGDGSVLQDGESYPKPSEIVKAPAEGGITRRSVVAVKIDRNGIARRFFRDHVGTLTELKKLQNAFVMKKRKVEEKEQQIDLAKKQLSEVMKLASEELRVKEAAFYAWGQASPELIQKYNLAEGGVEQLKAGTQKARDELEQARAKAYGDVNKAQEALKSLTDQLRLWVDVNDLQLADQRLKSVQNRLKIEQEDSEKEALRVIWASRVGNEAVRFESMKHGVAVMMPRGGYESKKKLNDEQLGLIEEVQALQGVLDGLMAQHSHILADDIAKQGQISTPRVPNLSPAPALLSEPKQYAAKETEDKKPMRPSRTPRPDEGVIHAEASFVAAEKKAKAERYDQWKQEEINRAISINKDLRNTKLLLLEKIAMFKNAGSGLSPELLEQINEAEQALQALKDQENHIALILQTPEVDAQIAQIQEPEEVEKLEELSDSDDEDECLNALQNATNPVSPKNPVTSGFRAPPSSPAPAGSGSVYQDEAEEDALNPATTEAVRFDLSHVEDEEDAGDKYDEKPEVTRQSTFTSVNNALKAISSMSHWTEFVTEFVDASNPTIFSSSAVTGEMKKHASASPVEIAKVTTSVVSDVNEIARIVKDKPDTIADLSKIAGDINPDKVNINDIFRKMHDAGIDLDKTGLDKDLVTILRNHGGDLSRTSSEILASQTPEQNKITMALSLANMSSEERDEIKEKMNKDVTSLVKLDVATLVHRKVMAKFNVNALDLEGFGISAGGLAAGDEEDTSRARFKGIWVSSLYGRNEQDPVDRKVGYKGIVSGITVGTDLTIGENSTIGIAYSHLDSGFKFGQEKTGDKVNASSNVFSLYGQTILNDNIIFQSVMSYLKSQIKSTSKRLVAPGAYRIANGKYNSNSFNAELLVNYKYDNGSGIILMPNVGLKFGRNRDGGYNENGAGLYDLSIASRKQNSLTGIAGVNVMMPKKLSDNTELIPSLNASVETILRQHQEDVKVNLKWLGQDSNHEVHIPKSGNVGYDLGGGLMLKHKNAELLATYNYHTRKKYRSHQGSLKLQLLF